MADEHPNAPLWPADTLPHRLMPIHLRTLAAGTMALLASALACSLASAPLAAQTDPRIEAGGDAVRTSAATTPPATRLDPRLLVREDSRGTARLAESSAWADSITRPRWRYPAIGAAVGVAAGLIHGHFIMQGDPIGIPADARYILAPAYGLAGAFLGLLIDSAERERAARWD